MPKTFKLQLPLRFLASGQKQLQKLYIFLFYFSVMALLPPHLSLKLNSSLKPLLITLPWMIQGLFLPLLPPSDYFMPLIKMLRNYIFHALAGLNPRKAYEPHGGSPPIVL